MNQFSQEIREKKALLAALQADYRQAADELAVAPKRAELLRPFSGFFGRLLAGLFVHERMNASVRSLGTVTINSDMKRT